jgi:hypothetical protein
METFQDTPLPDKNTPIGEAFYKFAIITSPDFDKATAEIFFDTHPYWFEDYKPKKNKTRSLPAIDLNEFIIKDILLRKLEERYEILENGCWQWIGAFNVENRPVIGIYESPTSSPGRIMYILYKGGIPEGRPVYRNCKNRLCVNPEHLYHTKEKGRRKKKYKPSEEQRIRNNKKKRQKMANMSPEEKAVIAATQKKHYDENPELHKKRREENYRKHHVARLIYAREQGKRRTLKRRQEKENVKKKL